MRREEEERVGVREELFSSQLQATPLSDIYDNRRPQSNTPKKKKKKKRNKNKQEAYFYDDDGNGVLWNTLPILT